MDLHAAPHDLHGTDVGETPAAKGVDREFQLVRVRDIGAYPAAVPEMGDEVVEGVLDIRHVGGDDVRIIEIDIDTARIAYLI